MTSRRDLSQFVAETKLRSPSQQTTRVSVDPGQRQKDDLTMRPRADNQKKRNAPLKEKTKRCKDRPENTKSKGGASRRFAGRYC